LQGRGIEAAAAGAMAGGGLAAALELAVVFLVRPLLAVIFVFTLILLSTPPLPLPVLSFAFVGCSLKFPPP